MGASRYQYETSPIVDANVDDRLLELDRTFDHLSAVVPAETIVRQSGWTKYDGGTHGWTTNLKSTAVNPLKMCCLNAIEIREVKITHD